MWPILPNVTFGKLGLSVKNGSTVKNWSHFEMCFKCYSVAHVSKCDAFFIVWSIFKLVDAQSAEKCFLHESLPSQMSLWHFTKCDSFDILIYQNLNHFSRAAWPNFHSVTNFWQFAPFFQMWRLEKKFLFTVWKMGHIWKKLATLGKMGHTWKNGSHFEMCSKFYSVTDFFLNVTHFSQCDQFSTVWPKNRVACVACGISLADAFALATRL